MPREAVHCEILDRVRDERLPTLLITHEHFAYLGALAPDAAYYYRLGCSSLESVAERLHGSGGEDTFELPRALAHAIIKMPVDKRDPLWAFLVGYISHCIVDSVFHPVIYFLTGNYYDEDDLKRQKARTQHRAFEVFLDSWWGTNMGAPYYDLLSYWRKASRLPEGKILMTLLQDITSGQATASEWRNSFWYLGAAQRIFHSKNLGSLVRKGATLMPGLMPYDALFSHQREKGLPEFDAPLFYKNPVTGSEETVTLLQLRQRAITECLQLVKKLEPLIGGDSVDVDAALAGVEGRSLNSGTYGATKKDMKFFKSDQ